MDTGIINRDCDNLDENDVETDCAVIEHIHPIPSDLDFQGGQIKDIRYSSVDSGYDSVKSINSGIDSVSDDLGKLKLESIDEISIEREESELYDPLQKSNEQIGQAQNQKNNANNEIREKEEMLLQIFKPDKDGDSQLHMSIIQLLSPITIYFINLVPSHHWLNLPNNLLQVPLHLAAITRQTKIVRKLMVAGADITARDYKGDTPLHIACREGYDDIAQVLLTPVEYNETCDVRYPLQLQNIPQDMQLMNYNGQTCLHLAAERCHLHIIRLLLQNGAAINSKDGKCGKTVLHYAAESGNSLLLEFLISQPKVDLNATTYGGLTAVQLAGGRRHNSIVSMLIRSGAIDIPVEENESDDEMNE